MEIVHALVASYLIATLAATVLAKLKNWRHASMSVTRESIIPHRAATTTVITVAIMELLLAAVFALGIEPAVAGFAGMGLFLAFCGYQLLVAAKTNSLMCSCAGTARTDPASPPAVAGTTISCLVQSALCCVLAITHTHPSILFYLFTVPAGIIPVTLLLAGLLRQTRWPEMNGRFWLAG